MRGGSSTTDSIIMDVLVQCLFRFRMHDGARDTDFERPLGLMSMCVFVNYPTLRASLWNSPSQDATHRYGSCRVSGSALQHRLPSPMIYGQQHNDIRRVQHHLRLLVRAERDLYTERIKQTPISNLEPRRRFRIHPVATVQQPSFPFPSRASRE